ncbi:hypothetical protein D3C81_2139340 [compost metagenome]
MVTRRAVRSFGVSITVSRSANRLISTTPSVINSTMAWTIGKSRIWIAEFSEVPMPG